jgi:hypothetical protein
MQPIGTQGRIRPAEQIEESESNMTHKIITRYAFAAVAVTAFVFAAAAGSTAALAQAPYPGGYGYGPGYYDYAPGPYYDYAPGGYAERYSDVPYDPGAAALAHRYGKHYGWCGFTIAGC